MNWVASGSLRRRVWLHRLGLHAFASYAAWLPIVLFLGYRGESNLLVQFVGFSLAPIALPAIFVVLCALTFWPDTRPAPALVPLIAIAYAIALALVAWRWKLKPLPTSICAACGYDLRGSPGPICPECGAAR